MTTCNERCIPCRRVLHIVLLLAHLVDEDLRRGVECMDNLVHRRHVSWKLN